MSTREIYFKMFLLTDMPVGLVGYVYKDNNEILQVVKIPLEFRMNPKIYRKSIKIMEDIEKTPNFMFWNNSIEGENFFKEIIWMKNLKNLDNL